METLADMLGTVENEQLRMTDKQQRVLRAAAKRDLHNPAVTKAEIANEADVDPTYIDHVLSRVTEDVLAYFREGDIEPEDSVNSDDAYDWAFEGEDTGKTDTDSFETITWSEGVSFILNSGDIPLLVEVSIPKAKLNEEIEERLSQLF